MEPGAGKSHSAVVAVEEYLRGGGYHAGTQGEERDFGRVAAECRDAFLDPVHGLKF